MVTWIKGWLDATGQLSREEVHMIQQACNKTHADIHEMVEQATREQDKQRTRERQINMWRRRPQVRKKVTVACMGGDRSTSDGDSEVSLHPRVQVRSTITRRRMRDRDRSGSSEADAQRMTDQDGSSADESRSASCTRDAAEQVHREVEHSREDIAAMERMLEEQTRIEEEQQERMVALHTAEQRQAEKENRLRQREAELMRVQEEMAQQGNKQEMRPKTTTRNSAQQPQQYYFAIHNEVNTGVQGPLTWADALPLMEPYGPAPGYADTLEGRLRTRELATACFEEFVEQADVTATMRLLRDRMGSITQPAEAKALLAGYAAHEDEVLRYLQEQGWMPQAQEATDMPQEAEEGSITALKNKYLEYTRQIEETQKELRQLQEAAEVSRRAQKKDAERQAEELRQQRQTQEVEMRKMREAQEAEHAHRRQTQEEAYMRRLKDMEAEEAEYAQRRQTQEKAYMNKLKDMDTKAAEHAQWRKGQEDEYWQRYQKMESEGKQRRRGESSHGTEGQNTTQHTAPTTTRIRVIMTVDSEDAIDIQNLEDEMACVFKVMATDIQVCWTDERRESSEEEGMDVEIEVIDTPSTRETAEFLIKRGRMGQYQLRDGRVMFPTNTEVKRHGETEATQYAKKSSPSANKENQKEPNKMSDEEIPAGSLAYMLSRLELSGDVSVQEVPLQWMILELPIAGQILRQFLTEWQRGFKPPPMEELWPYKGWHTNKDVAPLFAITQMLNNMWRSADRRSWLRFLQQRSNSIWKAVQTQGTLLTDQMSDVLMAATDTVTKDNWRRYQTLRKVWAQELDTRLQDNEEAEKATVSRINPDDVAKGVHMVPVRKKRSPMDSQHTSVEEGGTPYGIPGGTDTELHTAVRNNCMVEALRALREGADVNYIHGGYRTSPIHQAIMQGSLQMVDLLMTAGANTGIKNDEGETAEQLAHALRDMEPLPDRKQIYLRVKGLPIKRESTTSSASAAIVKLKREWLMQQVKIFAIDEEGTQWVTSALHTHGETSKTGEYIELEWITRAGEILAERNLAETEAWTDPDDMDNEKADAWMEASMSEWTKHITTALKMDHGGDAWVEALDTATGVEQVYPHSLYEGATTNKMLGMEEMHKLRKRVREILQRPRERKGTKAETMEEESWDDDTPKWAPTETPRQTPSKRSRGKNSPTNSDETQERVPPHGRNKKPSNMTDTRSDKPAFESRYQALMKKHGGRYDQAKDTNDRKNIIRQFLKEIPQGVKEEAKRRARDSWRGKPNRDSLNAVGEQVYEAWKVIERKRPLGYRFTTGEHIRAKKMADDKEMIVARYRTIPGQILSKAGMEDQDTTGHSKHKQYSWSNVIPREQRGKIRGMFGIREPRPGESINAAIMPVPSTHPDPHTLVLYSTKHIQQGEEILMYFGADFEHRTYEVAEGAQEEDDAAYTMLKTQHEDEYGKLSDESDEDMGDGTISSGSEKDDEESYDDGSWEQDNDKTTRHDAGASESDEPQEGGDDKRGGQTPHKRGKKSKHAQCNDGAEVAALSPSPTFSHSQHSHARGPSQATKTTNTSGSKTKSAQRSKQTNSGVSAHRPAKCASWKSQDITQAENTIDEASSRHGSLGTMEAVFKTIYDAVTQLKRRHKEPEVIFVVLDRLWKKITRSGAKKDGQGTPKDVLRKMFRCIQLDMSGEWLDGGYRVREICDDCGGVVYILDMVAGEVLGRTWSQHLRREIEEYRMDPTHSDMEHYAKFRDMVDQIPKAFRHEDQELAECFMNSIPDEMSGSCRILYNKRSREDNNMTDRLDLAYECMQAVWMRHDHVSKNTYQGQKGEQGRKRRDMHTMEWGEEEPQLCVMEGFRGQKKWCQWCADNDRRANHYPQRCYASGNPESEMPLSLRQGYGGGKKINITRTLCMDGADPYEMEKAFKAAGYGERMGRIACEELDKTGEGRTKPCKNPNCRLKMDPGHEDLKAIRGKPNNCEANDSYCKAMAQRANDIYPDPEHTAQVNSLQAEEQEWLRESKQ